MFSFLQPQQRIHGIRLQCINLHGDIKWVYEPGSFLQASRIVVPRGTEIFFSFISTETIPPIVSFSPDCFFNHKRSLALG